MKLLRLTGIFLILLRAFNVFLLFVLKDTALLDRMVNDSLHHYHYGIILFLVYLVLRLKYKLSPLYPIGICLAAIIDEYSIILYEARVMNPVYLYGTWEDNVAIVCTGLCMIILSEARNRKQETKGKN